ncbi:VOC family protein [Streptomyces sp. NPDC001927]
MTDPKRYPPGTPCWVDVLAHDPKAAFLFYKRIFDWQGGGKDQPDPPAFGEISGYAICSLDGKAVAGIGTVSVESEEKPALPTGWTTHLASADIDTTSKAIVQAGGTLLRSPYQIGSLGRLLVARDPTEAVFGVWQPDEFTGAQIRDEPGAMVWNELRTSDPRAAAMFYQTVFGLEPSLRPGPSKYYELTLDRRPIGGIRELDASFPVAHWLVCFAVVDVDETARTANEYQAPAILVPSDHPMGQLCILKDPQGAVFALLQLKPNKENTESVLADAFSRSLGERWKSLRNLEAHQANLDADTVRTIGQDAAARALSNLSWRIALGDCTTARSLATTLSLPVQSVIDKVQHGQLVGLQGRHETFLPLWQFAHGVADKEPSYAVSQVLRVFVEGLGDAFSPELVVLWAATEQPELGNREPRTAVFEVPPGELEWSAKCAIEGLTQ